MADRRHLISIDDLGDDDLRQIIRRGTEFAAGSTENARQLADAVVGMLFRKTSTRGHRRGAVPHAQHEGTRWMIGLSHERGQPADLHARAPPLILRVLPCANALERERLCNNHIPERT